MNSARILQSKLQISGLKKSSKSGLDFNTRHCHLEPSDFFRYLNFFRSKVKTNHFEIHLTIHIKSMLLLPRFFDVMEKACGCSPPVRCARRKKKFIRCAHLGWRFDFSCTIIFFPGSSSGVWLSLFSASFLPPLFSFLPGR